MYDEDRERRGVETDRPYGMAARDQGTPDATGRDNPEDSGPACTPSAGHTSPDSGTPRRFTQKPQQQASAPRGRPVPARGADNGVGGHGDRDRTQYEQDDGGGGSHAADESRPGRGHTHRGDQH